MSPAPTSAKSSHPPFNEGAAHVAAPSRFGVPSLDEMPDDIRAICEETRAKIGFVPNVFLAYAKRPEHFRAFMHYHDLLMKGPSGLSRAEREAIVVAVSAENACLYCVTSHGAALRILGKDPFVADQIAVNWRTAELSPRLRAILTFASRVNDRGFAASDKELAELKALGLTDDDAWDIAAVAAFFGFSNRMAGLMDMRPNPQFYAMGRAADGR
ncbi:alkyl hydroperoxide reductase AhpD [Vulcanimicrobium alpinum]|uniref:Alkyl hydroperoxide reductase AhpD n=1 Tax=Vulcanimicrobium alpinum TaxID=3016050 RepID=A0AAN2C8N4_UNVUL|nr:peroxidase-related enzyme [Vulcanimicrobium alpinum]BDE05128.1 alkyl hydroperoxide reductase AhpD [Vulcanimicrobium alpinum]